MPHGQLVVLRGLDGPVLGQGADLFDGDFELGIDAGERGEREIERGEKGLDGAQDLRHCVKSVGGVLGAGG